MSDEQLNGSAVTAIQEIVEQSFVPKIFSSPAETRHWQVDSAGNIEEIIDLPSDLYLWADSPEAFSAAIKNESMERVSYGPWGAAAVKQLEYINGSYGWLIYRLRATPTAQYEVVEEMSLERIANQVRLLRTLEFDLRGCAPETFINCLRNISFFSSQAVNSERDRTMRNTGENMTQELRNGKEFQQSVTLNLPVFIESAETAPVEIHIEVDLNQRGFRLQSYPGELLKAKMIVIEKMLELARSENKETPFYEGQFFVELPNFAFLNRLSSARPMAVRPMQYSLYENKN